MQIHSGVVYLRVWQHLSALPLGGGWQRKSASFLTISLRLLGIFRETRCWWSSPIFFLPYFPVCCLRRVSFFVSCKATVIIKMIGTTTERPFTPWWQPFEVNKERFICHIVRELQNVTTSQVKRVHHGQDLVWWLLCRLVHKHRSLKWSVSSGKALTSLTSFYSCVNEYLVEGSEKVWCWNVKSCWEIDDQQSEPGLVGGY